MERKGHIGRSILQIRQKALYVSRVYVSLRTKGVGIDKEPNLVQEYTEYIREKCIESKYDAIIYPNDFESQEGVDSTSYIVFLPN